ncbi:MAG: GPR endopeptidase [Eubacteriaceae bacterium]|nr:GPR endopeptidase [Eubacteriaceae bacterium]
MRFRTDLALEAKQNLEESGIKPGEKDGIISETFEIDEDIKVTSVDIISEKGEILLGKAKGKYVTLEIEKLFDQLPAGGNSDVKSDIQNRAIHALADQLSKFVKHSYYLKTLVIGLGNAQVTPDSLGPATLNQTCITRHLFRIYDCDGDDEYSSVCGLAPGVTGTTGLETADIVEEMVKLTKPDAVIIIDALAAREIERVSTTIQISNTGISPGAGMGNYRKELSRGSLGTEVIAIGVPTVIDADRLLKNPQCDVDMVVTPSNIDDVIRVFSHIISSAINICLHPGIYS